MSINVESQIATDDGRALVEMARLGLGIIMIDPLLVKTELDSHQLVPILTDWQHPETLPINLICLGKKYLSRASTSIWDALSIHLKLRFYRKKPIALCSPIRCHVTSPYRQSRQPLRAGQGNDLRHYPFPTPIELHQWFAQNHDSDPELWIQIFKTASGMTSVTWTDCDVRCTGT